VAPGLRTTEAILEELQFNQSRLEAPLYAPLVSVTASLRDMDGSRRDFDLRGILVAQAPRSMYLKLDHPLEPGQLLLGSNDDEYWLAIRRGHETMWWGRYRNLGRPEVEPLLVEPPRVADALGVRSIRQDGLLGPIRLCEERFDRLIYQRKGPDGRLSADREYLVDRYSPFRVRRINYFDALGRVEMFTLLDQYRPVEGAGTVLARRIEIRWPARESWMRLELEGVKIPERVHPRAFVRPEQPPEGIRQVIQVDRACESGALEGWTPLDPGDEP
jgi:hypothetical protein